jgi:hypothetical protein
VTAHRYRRPAGPDTERLQFVPPTTSIPALGPIRHAAAPRAVPTSGTATVAFLLALAGPLTLGVGSGAAVILAATAWRSTRDGERGGHGLTVSAIVLGAVGMAAVLAAAWLFRDVPLPDPFRSVRVAR